MQIRFSRRVPEDLRPTRLAEARRRAGPLAADLTLSNPTRAGIDYPARLLECLADPAGLVYKPDPKGPHEGREAVAADYRRWGVEVDPEHIVLCASTSDAYGLLFRLLADPGDVVLAPTPSYPLFDQLARLDGIQLAPIVLDHEAHWRLDPASLAAAPPRTKAAIVVHPNNPTGSFIHPDDRRLLATRCADAGWALIADEVFLPFPLAGGPGHGTSFAGEDRCLTFSLGGLSKSCGLPQLKAAWIAVSGPEAQVAHALERLEWVADAYLSIATPVALALPQLLERALPVQHAIADRCLHNLEQLSEAVSQLPSLTLDLPAGGWSAVIRFPKVVSEETLVLELLEHDRVAVHPGYLFDLPGDGWLVVSLLPPEEEFSLGIERLIARIRHHGG